MNMISPQSKYPHLHDNPRTAGSMPVLGQKIDDQAFAIQKKEGHFADHLQTPEKISTNANGQNIAPHDTTMHTGNNKNSNDDDGFGFFDLVDMVNPLHHIPVLNIIYRAITGDEIKPIGQIIGGAVYGGFAGASSGIVNAIVTHETGKDIGGNALSLIRNNEKPHHDIKNQSTTQNQHNTYTDNRIAYDDLPAALLSHAEIPLSPSKSGDTA